ncbi:MAG: hypothetical protein Q4E57_02940 [Eubacteriales bacterium]|nr:hypothetical protein [Eubacteriales bacterium]
MFDNIQAMMKIRSAWATFTGNHPKFAAFLTEVGRSGAPEGTIIEIHMEYPDGRTISSNMRVNASDIELIESLRNLKQ